MKDMITQGTTTSKKMADQAANPHLEPADYQKLVAVREGETKIGQRIISLESATDLAQSLQEAKSKGCRFAVLGVPEDIGPRANYGRGGSDKAYSAFLSYFLNMQANRFFDPGELVFVGSLWVSDLLAKANREGKPNPSLLQDLCAELDSRLAPIVRKIVGSGLEPIIIGGGNNNSLPILQGLNQGLKDTSDPRGTTGASIVNLDAHADFRRLEGRHSGNPFSYAYDQGLLARYLILCFMEAYNNEDMIDRLAASGFKTISYEDIFIKKTIDFRQAVEQTIAYLADSKGAIAAELDLDVIKAMPASAETCMGVSEEEALYFIYQTASRLNTAYLHISEGAPSVTAGGDRKVGRFIAMAVLTYLKGRSETKVGSTSP